MKYLIKGVINKNALPYSKPLLLDWYSYCVPSFRLGVIIVFRLSKPPLKKERETGNGTEPGTPQRRGQGADADVDGVSIVECKFWRYSKCTNKSEIYSPQSSSALLNTTYIVLVNVYTDI